MLLKELLSKNNYNVTDFAKKLKIDRGTLYRYFEDIKKAPYKIIAMISAEFNILPHLLDVEGLKSDVYKKYVLEESNNDLIPIEEMKLIDTQVMQDFTKRIITKTNNTVEKNILIEVKFHFNIDSTQYIYKYVKYDDNEIDISIYSSLDI